MRLVNDVIETIEYIKYTYDSKEEKKIHMKKMCNDNYEYLINLNDELEATYRKVFETQGKSIN